MLRNQSQLVQMCNWSLCARGSTLWLLRKASLLVLLLSSFLRAAGSATFDSLDGCDSLQGYCLLSSFTENSLVRKGRDCFYVYVECLSCRM